MSIVLLFFAVLGAFTGSEIAASSFPRACVKPHNTYPFCNTSLSLSRRVDNLISLLHDDEIGSILTARESVAVPRIGLPAYDWGMNAIHGVQSKCAGNRCPTSFPNPCGLGASFNSSMVHTLGAVIGFEARALWHERIQEGHHDVPIGLDAWSPNININRDPRWGRNQEVPGEDPFWTGVYGEMYTKGIQAGPDKRYLLGAVTLKHWMAYSVDKYGNASRHSFNAVISKYDFHNTYTPGWEQAIRAGQAEGIMCSYNAVNGTPTCASRWLLKVLKQDFNYSGYITSDSGALNNIWKDHHYTPNATTAAAAAAKAECDINSGGIYKHHLEEAVREGFIPKHDVHRLLRQSFKIRFKLGLFDPIENQPYWHVPPDVVGKKYHEDMAKLATLESMVLLKNDKKTLPLKPGSKVAVIGPHAKAQKGMCGNYLGHLCPGGGFECLETPAQALTKANVGGTTTVEEGCKSITDCPSSQTGKAIAAVKQSDVVVFFGGIGESIERESHDRHNITIPEQQVAFIEEVIKVGKPIVLVLFNGGALSIESFVNGVDSVLEAWYPSFHGGAALAETIFGNYNPGGKLSQTFYKADYVNQIPFLDMSMTVPPGRGYRYYTGTPAYPFGFGLSYTTFSLKFGQAAATHIVAEHGIGYTAEVHVRNTGDREGDEVVMAFFKPKNVTLPSGRTSPLLKQLFGFQRVRLGISETKKLQFMWDTKTLAMHDFDGTKVVPEGMFELVFSRGHGVELTQVVKIASTRTVRQPLV